VFNDFLNGSVQNCRVFFRDSKEFPVLMSRTALRRLVLAASVVALAAGLGACSGGIDRGEYTAPVAATSAPPPAPVVPAVVPGSAPVRSNRLPLLPPVPEEQSGLPPVTVAQLLPPTVY
jgi:hypothetical protein